MESISEANAIYLTALLMLGELFTHDEWMDVRGSIEFRGFELSSNIGSGSKNWVDGEKDKYYVTDKGKEALANFNKEK